jgi:hypothetical protein
VKRNRTIKIFPTHHVDQEYLYEVNEKYLFGQNKILVGMLYDEVRVDKVFEIQKQNWLLCSLIALQQNKLQPRVWRVVDMLVKLE